MNFEEQSVFKEGWIIINIQIINSLVLDHETVRAKRRISSNHYSFIMVMAACRGFAHCACIQFLTATKTVYDLFVLLQNRFASKLESYCTNYFIVLATTGLASSFYNGETVWFFDKCVHRFVQFTALRK